MAECKSERSCQDVKYPAEYDEVDVVLADAAAPVFASPEE